MWWIAFDTETTVAHVLQTMLIELWVCEIHSETEQTWANNSLVKCLSYDRCEHQTLQIYFVFWSKANSVCTAVSSYNLKEKSFATDYKMTS